MRILVANRGEIALRIIRTIKSMGHEAIAVYSIADQESLHVKSANFSVCLGEGPVNKSYLHQANILSACTSLGVDFIHPGFGFLSENSEFVKLCEELNIGFIGPKADTIDLMGNKINALKAMINSGIPTVSDINNPITSHEILFSQAEHLGFPIIIKSSNGGGGKGIRIVKTKDTLKESFDTVYQEACLISSDPDIYMEKFLTDAKHIEVQILADKHGNVIHLGTRDCSMQRNNQKIIEEAPALINKIVLEEMETVCVKASKDIGYIGAGTFEFLYKDNKFYFLEMNTRIQVEHTITEAITGIDIVEQQIRIASGERLSLEQKDIKFTGHAIEFRINAENPLYNFSPSPGHIKKLYLPGGPNVRNDFGVLQGMEIPPFYDSMIGKIILHKKSRDQVIEFSKIILEEFYIEGVDSTVEFQKKLIREKEFKNNTYATTFIEQNSDRIIQRMKKNVDDK